MENNESFEVGDDYFIKLEGKTFEKIDEGNDSFVYKNEDNVLKIYHSLRLSDLETYYFLLREFENFLYQKYISGELKSQIKIRKPKTFGVKKIGKYNWVFSESEFIKGQHFEVLKEKKYVEIHQQIEKYLGEFLGKKVYHLHKKNIKLLPNGEIILVDIGNEIPKFLTQYKKSKDLDFKFSLKQILGF